MRRVPELNRPMVLEDRVLAPDTMGGQLVSWIALGTHWCELVARSMALRLLADHGQAKGTARILLRAVAPDVPSRPKTGQRFRDGARIFNIISVSEADAEGRFLECQVSEVQR